ncbi:N-acetyltransferase [Streptomyces sp. NPDC050636]|uniref:N-acetyltransferase n=1 Tax=Streptomyces sp. NPDC050636 TaxID=3154510 RepID=UPI003440846C
MGPHPRTVRRVVPEYNLHGDINCGYWTRLFEDFPAYQFVLYDDAHDEILGAGRPLPRTWGGTAQGLGPGLDDSIARAFADQEAGRSPDALCALGIEVAAAHQSKGLSKVLLDQMTATARSAGLGTVLVPVRPTWKERYPLAPIERYAAWTRDDGSSFDPWVRTQVQAGAASPPPRTGRRGSPIRSASGSAGRAWPSRTTASTSSRADWRP